MIDIEVLDLTALRAEVAQEIDAIVPVGVSVADQAVRSIALPAVVLTPGVPYAVPAPEAWCATTVRLVAWVMVGREIERPLDLLEEIAARVREAIGGLRGIADDGITAAGDVEPMSGIPYLAARIDFRISR